MGDSNKLGLEKVLLFTVEGGVTLDMGVEVPGEGILDEAGSPELFRTY